MEPTHSKISPRNHLLLAWSGPVVVLVFFIGMVPLSGFIPPSDPGDSAREVVAWYQDDLTARRLGLILAALSFTLMLPWGASIAVWTWRIEKGFPGLTVTSVACLAAGAAMTYTIFVVWSVAAFRPGEYDPETVLMLHDLGWFLFLWIVPPFCVWSVAIGLAIFQDTSENPVYPRWVAYLNFWEALLMTPALVITFAKNGPFAYNGVFAFWIPVIAFFIWMVTMTVFTIRAIHRQAREQAPVPPPAGTREPQLSAGA